MSVDPMVIDYGLTVLSGIYIPGDLLEFIASALEDKALAVVSQVSKATLRAAQAAAASKARAKRKAGSPAGRHAKFLAAKARGDVSMLVDDALPVCDSEPERVPKRRRGLGRGGGGDDDDDARTFSREER